VKRLVETERSGNDSSKIINDFDIKGNVVAENPGNGGFRTIITCDGQNRMTKYILYIQGKFKKSTIFKYSFFNNQTDQYDSFRDCKLRLVARVICKYDNKGNEIEKKEIKLKNELNPNDELIRTTTTKYDNKGNKIAITVISGEG
jgi:hypothetical protein